MHHFLKHQNKALEIKHQRNSINLIDNKKNEICKQNTYTYITQETLIWNIIHWVKNRVFGLEMFNSVVELAQNTSPGLSNFIGTEGRCRSNMVRKLWWFDGNGKRFCFSFFFFSFLFCCFVGVVIRWWEEAYGVDKWAWWNGLQWRWFIVSTGVADRKEISCSINGKEDPLYTVAWYGFLFGLVCEVICCVCLKNDDLCGFMVLAAEEN